MRQILSIFSVEGHATPPETQPTPEGALPMQFAYLTLDEMNQDLAARLADAAGVELDVLSFHAPAPDGPFDAVLYDLDYLPDDRRAALLATPAAGCRGKPVAVHGYHPSAGAGRALRRQGVLVARHLDAELFVRLRLAARQVNKVPS